MSVARSSNPNLGSSFSRRQILKRIALLSTFPVLASCSHSDPVKPPKVVGSAAIDVHCHVFNASDLPVRGFVHRVVLGDHEDTVVFPLERPEGRAVLPALSALLVEILSGPAPTAREELDAFERVGRIQPSHRQRRTQEVRVLENILKSFERRTRSVRPGATGPDQPDFELLLKALREEVAGEQPRSLEPEPQDSKALARALLSSRGAFGRNISWAFKLLHPRHEIVHEINQLYGGEGGISLFTPALIDYSGWLEDEPRSSLADQIAVMDRLQRMQDESAMLHCFAPFDPWRQVVDEHTGRQPTALELVKHAIMDCGFIGVKMYPPMGFLPTSNAQSGLRYPERAADVDPERFPELIDNALEELYQWCAVQSVPIMAHATNSNGAGDRFAERAHPVNWQPVLAQFPNLRINLAHFGDFEEALSLADAAKSWEWAIGRLVAGGPHVFADLSYLHEFLGDRASAEKRDNIRRLLREFINSFDPDLERLMYGSDWIMLGRELEQERYLTVMVELLEALSLDQDHLHHFFGQNASRYLGLRQNEPTRLRLEAYYRRHGLDASRLYAFDLL